MTFGSGHRTSSCSRRMSFFNITRQKGSYSSLCLIAIDYGVKKCFKIVKTHQLSVYNTELMSIIKNFEIPSLKHSLNWKLAQVGSLQRTRYLQKNIKTCLKTIEYLKSKVFENVSQYLKTENTIVFRRQNWFRMG